MPCSVIIAFPVFAAFGWTTTVTAGASQVNPSAAVPISDEIVRTAFALTDIKEPEVRHVSELDVDQLAVAQ
jgi:hypothetical protein